MEKENNGGEQKRRGERGALLLAHAVSRDYGCAFTRVPPRRLDPRSAIRDPRSAIGDPAIGEIGAVALNQT